MSRVSFVPVLALINVLIPSVGQAQMYVIPSCTDPAVMSRSSYDRPVPCVPLVPIPPTSVPAWLRPAPMPAPAPAAPSVMIAPASPPLSVAPVPAGRGIDPWIPLAGRPAPRQRPLDLMTQMLLIEQLAAARRQQHAVPAPPVQRSTPSPPATPDVGWMHGFFKGVK